MNAFWREEGREGGVEVEGKKEGWEGGRKEKINMKGRRKKEGRMESKAKRIKEERREA